MIQLQDLAADVSTLFPRIMYVPPRMRVAGRQHNPTIRYIFDIHIAVVTVTAQRSLEILQECIGPRPRPTVGEGKYIVARARFVAPIDPQPSGSTSSSWPGVSSVTSVSSVFSTDAERTRAVSSMAKARSTSAALITI